MPNKKELKSKYLEVLETFFNDNPEPKTELFYGDEFQLLVAVVLSAQCLDSRVNQVTPKIFARYKGVEEIANADFDELFEIVRSISYPNAKTGYLISLSKRIVLEFNGRVPTTFEELTSLDGVGRKTANVMLSVLYELPCMAVDTHVFRVANRIGLTKAKNPLESEIELLKYIPSELVHKAHHWLILHGRYICKAKKPACESCKIADYCDYFMRS